MKNRAKCKICSDIIESLTPSDYQLCKCGSIFVDGGDALLCGAKDWSNFIRLDDNGIEHIPTIIEKDKINCNFKESKDLPQLTLSDKLDMLKEMIAGYDRLPIIAHGQPITHYDLQAALIVIYEILRHQ